MLLPLRLALNSLFIRRGRTLLTIFGIMIGIAAVIIVMSAGECIKNLVLGELNSFGSDFIQIETKIPNTGKNSFSGAGTMAQGVQITTLTFEDAEAIAGLPNIKNYYAAVLGQAVVSYLEENKITNFLGASSEIVNIDNSEIESGRFYSPQEEDQLARVVVLGSKVAEELFGGRNPLDQNIKVGKQKFKVIGVLKERGGGFGMNFDELAYIPLKTAQKIIMGVDHLMWITAQVKDPSIQDQTAEEIIYLLRQRHDTEDENDDDFAVTTQKEAQELIQTVFGGITLLLIAIAAISLLVGGIGIMNIMYVSVTERTFEIGLRKSIGAKPAQILWQFLWEAVAVTIFGGIIGVIIGVAVTYLVSLGASYAGFNWSFILPLRSVVIAFGFSAVVGLIFGYYPAKRAAKLDPIEALRHE